MINKSVTFEVLALDPKESSRAKSSESLTYAVLGFSDLWDKPVADGKKAHITDGHIKLQISAVEKPEQGDDDASRNSYFLTMVGPIEVVGPKREPVLAFLKDAGFSLLYVLKDETSEEIAKELYPYLYKVENLLRGYLIKFMSTRIGPNWWDKTVSDNVSLKAKTRKKNEKVFGRYINNDAHLVDFGELGEIVFSQTSGFVTREDIVAKIQKLEESAESVRRLKAELQTNYQRFFKESFADKGFQDKWRDFETLRNKIAHNNLFTVDDLETGRALAQELISIIQSADAKTQKVKITVQEREAIQERVLERSQSSNEITEEVFLDMLEEEEQRFGKKPNGFVGLSRFVKLQLPAQGYDSHSAMELCNKLAATGKLEIYHVPNPESEFPTAALRIAKHRANYLASS